MTNIVRERSNLASNVTVIKRQTVWADHTPTIELKRVAAYCRVSTDLEAQQSSIDLQMSSYENFRVIRKELFAHLRDPALTIRPDSITFNTVCQPSWGH